MRPSKNENPASTVARVPADQWPRHDAAGSHAVSGEDASCQAASSHAASSHAASSHAASSHAVRSGFSLIELLVAIVIIGILIGLLVPGVMTAYRRSQEFAIEQELNQLSAAIEAFKIKYGFYPPDFTRINSINEFLPYLNRIAPNHSESSAYLSDWWAQVGQKLRAAGPQASYVFWLSGLAKNKQYPLTDGSGNPLSAYNFGAIEREVFYDFKSEKLYYPLDLPPSPSASLPSYPVTMLTPITVQSPNRQIGELRKNGYSPMIATFSELSGACQPFVYFELKSLPQIKLSSLTSANFVPVNTSDATYNLFPYFQVVKISSVEYIDFYNGESFQVIAPGIDSQFSNPKALPRENTPNITAGTAIASERDNLTNFSEGRLERTINQ